MDRLWVPKGVFMLNNLMSTAGMNISPSKKRTKLKKRTKEAIIERKKPVNGSIVSM